ncbi:MAG: MFS transporter [Acidobacteria bacterium]|nr:MFS transporter [Acidobacteriota bacterium]
MRPVGGYLVGIWADHAGRWIPLIADVCFSPIIGFRCAFAPNSTLLFVLRLLYGIGMGGEWGPIAALSLEKAPRDRRGPFSDVLQSGCSAGYLLASLAFLLLPSAMGLSWRWMFALSITPALIALIIRTRVTESEVWVNTLERWRRSTPV